jgi:type I restriction enzyme, S subunit
MIPENWPIYTVKKLVELGILERPMDGNHGEIHPKASDFTQTGIPFIMATDINNGSLDLTCCKFISIEQSKRLRKGFSGTNDVLLTHKASIGRTAIVPKIESDYIMLTPQVTYYRVKDEKQLSNKYLRYYFDSDGFQKILNSYANGGSTRAYIGITEQLNLPIILPPIDIQINIANILSILDDKIELNLQMNKTLEAITQAIFKEWFVDFRFPGFDGELVDGLPKGWRKSLIAEFVESVSITHKFPFSNIVFLNTSDILNGEVYNHTPTKVKGLPGQAKKSIKKEDILFSEIRPANKRFAYIDFDADNYVVSTKLMVLRSKGLINQLVLYYFLKRDEILSELQKLAESRSGTFPQITFKELGNLEIIVPDKKLLLQYTSIISSLSMKIRMNQKENNTLIQIRDLLLPRLMSGKIKVT